MSAVDLDDIDEPAPRDFRRANGAPMVRRLDDPTKWDRYSRPSGWGSDLDDESNLVLWRIDRAMDGVATTPSLAAKICANLGRKEGRKELRDQAISIGRGEEAADLGTALHAMAERLEQEGGFRAPDPYAADLAAYLQALDEAGLVSEYIECKIVADEWRAAGTADRIYRTTRDLVAPDGGVVPAGSYLIGDLKTGKRLDYSLPGFAIQMAIYCDGQFYDLETDQRSPLPDGLNTRWGLLVHLPVGEAFCELLWCDLEVGREGARIVQDVRRWRKRSDFASHFVFPPSDEAAIMSGGLVEFDDATFVTPASASGSRPSGERRDDVSGDEPPGNPVNTPIIATDPPDWLEAMLPFAQERINVIGQASNEARNLLLRKWPEGTPTLRSGEITAPQLSKVLDLLDAIEAAFSIPFPAGDPRVEWHRGQRALDPEALRNRNQATQGTKDQ